jgi:cobalt-zinc-cadmium efflux system membrane fusion protein
MVAERAVEHPMTPLHILLAGEDEALEKALGDLLQGRPALVDRDTDPAHLRGRVAQHWPDLVLLDLDWPGAAALAGELGQGGAPLVHLSSGPVALESTGAAAAILKPISREELAKTIEAILQQSAPPAAGEPRRRFAGWLVPALVGPVITGLALLLILPVLGVHGLPNLLEMLAHKKPLPSNGGNGPQVTLVPKTSGTLQVPPEVARVLGVESASVAETPAPRTLVLSGSLAFDTNHLYRLQPRFGSAEVIEIATKPYPVQGPAGWSEVNQPIRVNDRVSKGQLLATLWSKDLGEKKSELIDALVKLAVDERNLKAVEELASQGATPQAVVRQARNQVSSDLNTVARVRRTLDVWKIELKEIAELEQEAQRILASKSKADLDRLQGDAGRWARYEIRSPADGVIVEKNLTVSNIVDPTWDLFKIVPLNKLMVHAHAYEEDLRLLQDLRAQHPNLPWEVRVSSYPDAEPLSFTPANGSAEPGKPQQPVIERISPIVDPNQHTALVSGVVDNVVMERRDGGLVRREGVLAAGQFVKAAVKLPPPPGVVSVPASAVVEDGQESIVFVRVDPKKDHYAMRRVRVEGRSGDIVYVRSKLDAADRKAGRQELRPGEWVVTQGSVELRAGLLEQEAKQHEAKGEGK